jgi:hypothetical protein
LGNFENFISALALFMVKIDSWFIIPVTIFLTLIGKKDHKNSTLKEEPFSLEED